MSVDHCLRKLVWLGQLPDLSIFGGLNRMQGILCVLFYNMVEVLGK